MKIQLPTSESNFLLISLKNKIKNKKIIGKAYRENMCDSNRQLYICLKQYRISSANLINN